MLVFMGLDFLFDWLLSFNPLISIVLISLIMSFISTIIYKYASDQKELKRLKEKIKKLQKKIKIVSKTDPQKAIKLNSELMKLNAPMMKLSMKPMLYTLLPSLIILAWMGSNLVYLPIHSNEVFNVSFIADNSEGFVTLSVIPDTLRIDMPKKKLVNNRAYWLLKAQDPGTYTLNFKLNNKTFSKDVLIDSKKYLNPITVDKSNGVKIVVSNKKLLPFKGLPVIGGLNWLWSYIIFSVIFSSLLKKLFKVV